MISFYSWLYKNQEILSNRIEMITGIKPIECFITIEPQSGTYGSYSPERVLIDEVVSDLIVLNKSIFGMGDKFIIEVLGHEMLHGVAKQWDLLADPHGQSFRQWEEKLNDWINKTTFDVAPDIRFKTGVTFVPGVGVSKTNTYQCGCNTTIYNTELLDVHCNKCNIQFRMIDCGLDDWETEERLRKQNIDHAAYMLKDVSDTQIEAMSSSSVVRSMKNICDPENTYSIDESTVSSQVVRDRLRKLYNSAVNYRFLTGEKTESRHVKRIAYLLSDNSD